MLRHACSVIFLIVLTKKVDGKIDEQITTCPSSMNFTWSFARRYSLTKQTNYENSEDLENCDKPDEFTTLVYEVMKLSSSYPTYRIHSSILQELMVRGFQLLCLWTQPLKERFKLINELKSATRPLSIADISTTSPSCTLRLSNLTIIGFPTQHGKLSTNPTNLRCPTNYKTYYEADSRSTTICGTLLVNDTSTGFMLTYRNVNVKINEIKTLTRKAPTILTKRIREEFQFENCTAQSTDIHLDTITVLEHITPALIEEIFKTDPTRRLAHASLSHDVKIAETYKQTVLRLTSNMLVEYLRNEYSTPYQIPSSYPLPAEIQQIKLAGLHLSKVCGSNMQIVRRENDLLMKLVFSLKFRDENNDTALIVKQRDFAQPEPIFIKQLIVRLEFSSLIEGKHNFSFHLVDVRAEIVDKYSTPWYQKYARKVNAVLGDILKDIILTWILYETN